MRYLPMKDYCSMATVLTAIASVYLMFSCRNDSDAPGLSGPKDLSVYTEWSSYLGDPGRMHYSSLDQINRDNISDLEVAWIYHSEDEIPTGRYTQCNPLVIDGVLYGSSPTLKIFALDAGSGRRIWQFDPYEGTDTKSFNRGLCYWEEGDDRRILFTAKEYLYALDAETGSPVSEFGRQGRIRISYGARWEEKGLLYENLTPGVIYKNTIILGSLNRETLPSQPGRIFAYDVISGEPKWVFNSIPVPGDFGYETWGDTAAYRFIGGANNWSGMTVDEERGIVFVPTGSAAFDFYGGNRKGANLFANTLLALDAETGKRIWHYQFVHHDLWDRDLPAPPNLVTVTRNGKKVDAVAQITKSGHVFLFGRETGEPLFPIEEEAYPTSDLRGEETWDSQPLPVLPPPFARQRFTESDINPFSNQKDSLLQVLSEIRSDGQFIPPSVEGTMMFPGFDGGGEWGGAAWDPASGILYVNSNEMPWILKMIELEEDKIDTHAESGKSIYQKNCMTCHGADLKGSSFHGDAPSLIDLKSRMKAEELSEIIKNGRGSMPSFTFLNEFQMVSVSDYLLEEESADSEETKVDPEEQSLPYGFAGYQRFTDGDGYPAVKPPWGTLNAIDLDKGEIKWQVPLGEYEELTERGIPKTGTENYGGSVVTAGGLIFIAATKDKYFRAFDKNTGEELWKYELPAAGLATPSVYSVDGRQYVVLAATGGKIVKEFSDTYIAFTLKE